MLQYNIVSFILCNKYMNKKQNNKLIFKLGQQRDHKMNKLISLIMVEGTSKILTELIPLNVYFIATKKMSE